VSNADWSHGFSAGGALSAWMLTAFLFVSLVLKFRSLNHYQAWASGLRPRVLSLLAARFAIRAEQMLIVSLAVASFTPIGPHFALAVATGLLLASLCLLALGKGTDCACLGLASRKINVAWLTSGLFCATLVLFQFRGTWILPLSALAAGWVLCLPLAWWLSEALARGSAGTRTIETAAEDESALLAEILAAATRPALPTVVLFTTRGCGPCEKAKAGMVRFAEAFGDRANYVVLDRGTPLIDRPATSGLAWMTRDDYRRGIFGIRWYPSALLVLPTQPATFRALPLDEDLSSALGALIF
jgi:hypothetical protein